jgi:DNA replication protein DnaC
MTEKLLKRAKDLHLNGVVAHWGDVATSEWLPQLLDWEEKERTTRSLERRIAAARIGRFKSIADYDWKWPKKCDRGAVEGLMTLDFINDGTNVVMVGPNGIGKTMLVKNIAHQTLIRGYTARFATAGELLGELAALDSDTALRRRLRHYASPDLLVIDEIGYLSYSNRHADLLFELVSRRYETKSTIITTNKAFKEWSEVFPNAACVVSLVDRLIHHSEIISLDGESYRLKEAQELAEKKSRQPRKKS